MRNDMWSHGKSLLYSALSYLVGNRLYTQKFTVSGDFIWLTISLAVQLIDG